MILMLSFNATLLTHLLTHDFNPETRNLMNRGENWLRMKKTPKAWSNEVPFRTVSLADAKASGRLVSTSVR